jgi:hypothetical protein
MLPELRIDAELRLEPLVGLDAVRGELDADAVGVLVTDPATCQRGRSRAHRVALDDDDPVGAAPGEVIPGAGAHDPGADDDDVRGGLHGQISVRSKTG